METKTILQPGASAPAPASAPTLELDVPVIPTLTPPPAAVGLGDTLTKPSSLTTTATAQPVAAPVTEVVLNRPKHITAESDAAIHGRVTAFVAAVQASPGDLSFAGQIMTLGDRANKVILPNSRLYEAAVNKILGNQQAGSPVNQDLLKIKNALDQINPSAVAARETTKMGGIRGLLGKVRSLLPEEVLSVIAARRDTVKNTIDGLKRGLYVNAEELSHNIAALEQVYNQLLIADAMQAEDVYLAQLLLIELQKLMQTLEPGSERSNVEALAADTAKRVMDLQAERAANQQFFAGSQGMARLTREQLKNIRSLMGLLERSVLANLGLRVVAVEMGRSIAVTSALSKAVGDTIADTGKMIQQQGTAMTASRSTANIDLDGLRAGAQALEKFFEEQGAANKQIIEHGLAVNAELSGMVRRLEARTAGGSPGQLLRGGNAPALNTKS